MMEILITIAEFGYWAVLVALAVLGAHRLHLALASLRAPPPACSVAPEVLPPVTVQLPLYNEANVAGRIIEASCRLQYPPELLEIQVLDDSNDETAGVVDSCVALWASRGVNVRTIRRADRTGYKAGALAHGLARARGEFVLVLDADFVPQRDLLLRLIGEFADPDVGMVQARWGHLNACASLLTGTQALMLDGHFAVEHAARAFNDRYFNFNGTAGIWRRAAISGAGGWQADTVTEDLDLSYRAQLRGWRFVYRPDVVVPAEIPDSVDAFKAQQDRWARGGVQTLRKLFPMLVRADVRLGTKLEALFHLGANLAYVPLLSLVFLQPMGWVDGPGSVAAWAGAAAFGFGVVGVAVFYVVARWRGPAAARWRIVVELPALFALGVGLSASQTRAVIAGLVGKDIEFLRTPKQGQSGRNRRYRVARVHPRWIDVAIALYSASLLGFAVRHHIWQGVPLAAMAATGFTWVAAASFRRGSGDIAARTAPPAAARIDGPVCTSPPRE